MPQIGVRPQKIADDAGNACQFLPLRVERSESTASSSCWPAREFTHAASALLSLADCTCPHRNEESIEVNVGFGKGGRFLRYSHGRYSASTFLKTATSFNYHQFPRFWDATYLPFPTINKASLRWEVHKSVDRNRVRYENRFRQPVART